MSDTHYFITYAAEAAERANGTFGDLKRAAAKALTETGLPTRKTEGWRKTDLGELLKTDLSPSTTSGKHVDRTWWRDSLNNCRMITLANGTWNQGCSNLADLPEGLEITSLSEAVTANGTAEFLGKVADIEQNPFTALNSAGFSDGLVIKVKKGTVVEQPIHIFHQTHAADGAAHVHPRLLVVAEANSQVQIVESFSGTGESSYLVNPVSEFIVKANAQVDHIRLQDDDRNAFHIGGTYVHQERDSRFISHALNIGGQVSRNDIVVNLDAEGTECTLNGLYLGENNQLHDTHSLIHHRKPNCNSYELYRGILDDKSKGVFNGMIHVYPQAQKTDAVQHNAALLLSDSARVNTEPQLEIYADDVKCTHGATVGQLDDKQLFYLESRGIDAERARGLLTVAFAAEAISSIKIPELFESVDEMLLNRFSED